ncbi:MAG: ribosome small subunit-dependent GTPase A [Candidatus Auribacterota bacterium]
MIELTRYGWCGFFEESFSEFAGKDVYPARVLAEYEKIYHVITGWGEFSARVSGSMRHQAKSHSDYPTVGDWVVVSSPSGVDQVMIKALLPRRTKFSRHIVESGSDEQVVGANIDTVFIVQGLDGDFNLRRLERYLVMSKQSGAESVVILNKTDLCDDIEMCVASAQRVAVQVPVHAICSITLRGYEQFDAYIAPGRTIALIGSSGVGKSTILNNLLGEEVQQVAEVRESDSRGRHTTTNKELFLLEKGGLMLDTPGMRELHLWDAEHGFHEEFTDIEEIALLCRFRGCRHDSEPGCAVKDAVENGMITVERVYSYRHLLDEKSDVQARARRKPDRNRGRQYRRRDISLSDD